MELTLREIQYYCNLICNQLDESGVRLTQVRRYFIRKYSREYRLGISAIAEFLNFKYCTNEFRVTGEDFTSYVPGEWHLQRAYFVYRKNNSVLRLPSYFNDANYEFKHF